MSSYSYYNYPNPSSIGPYKPGYQDTFQNQMIGGGSQTTYGLNAFSGSGTTRFNASSMLPVNGAVVDKFDTPMQFKSNQYSQVLNYLMTRSLDMAQGLPYNLYAANGRDLIQLGSQDYNLLQPAYLPTQQAQPMGYYPQPMAYAQAQQPMDTIHNRWLTLKLSNQWDITLNRWLTLKLSNLWDITHNRWLMLKLSSLWDITLSLWRMLKLSSKCIIHSRPMRLNSQWAFTHSPWLTRLRDRLIIKVG